MVEALENLYLRKVSAASIEGIYGLVLLAEFYYFSEEAVLLWMKT